MERNRDYTKFRLGGRSIELAVNYAREVNLISIDSFSTSKYMVSDQYEMIYSRSEGSYSRSSTAFSTRTSYL